MNANAELNRTLIEWVNNTGYKNDYFTVEKINNKTGEFEKMAVVNNQSKDISATHYNVFDNAPTEGDNTYRVKLAFQDGSAIVSDTKTLKFKGLSEIRVFPNPATNALSIDLTAYKNQDIEVYLYNYLGQQRAVKKLDKVENTVLELDVAEEQAGNYMLRIKSKGKREATKSVVVAH
jgi:predicted RNase H-like nuclease